MRIKLVHFESLELERQMIFEEYNTLKRNKEYDKAFEVLDYLEKNCYDLYLECYVPMITINKERSIIYRKLKQMKHCNYYLALSEIGGLLNSTYRRLCRDMLERYYFTNEFVFQDTIINNAAIQYIEWFKPVSSKMIAILEEIKLEYDMTYLDYEYISSRDIERHLYLKNEKLNEIKNEIKNNSFEKFLSLKDYLEK